MFGKLNHIIISLLLIISTTGFYISKHYCHGNLVSIVIDHEAESCCNMENCCHNETVFYHLDEDFDAPQNIQAPVQIKIDLFRTVLNEEFLTEILEADIYLISEYKLPQPKTVHSKLAEEQSYRL